MVSDCNSYWRKLAQNSSMPLWNIRAWRTPSEAAASQFSGTDHYCLTEAENILSILKTQTVPHGYKANNCAHLQQSWSLSQCYSLLFKHLVRMSSSVAGKLMLPRPLTTKTCISAFLSLTPQWFFQQHLWDTHVLPTEKITTAQKPKHTQKTNPGYSSIRIPLNWSLRRLITYVVSVSDLCFISMISTMWRSIGSPGFLTAKTESTTAWNRGGGDPQKGHQTLKCKIYLPFHLLLAKGITPAA